MFDIIIIRWSKSRSFLEIKDKDNLVLHKEYLHEFGDKNLPVGNDIAKFIAQHDRAMFSPIKCYDYRKLDKDRKYVLNIDEVLQFAIESDKKGH